MLQGLRLPGRTRPTAREVYRSEIGERVDWLLPEHKWEKGKDRPGVLICPRCHAISVCKRWFLDEDRYEQLRSTPGVQFVICPGCRRIQYQVYEGVVRLHSPLLLTNKAQAMAIIDHAEDKARQTNPFSRLASVVDSGDTIDILTTTYWLAERIGKEFHKAFKGTLELQRLPDERFVRVRWER
jgi:hypothetical protein